MQSTAKLAKKSKKDCEVESCYRRLLTENEIARPIVDVAYQIHTELGPGLLESVYEALLVHELEQRGLVVARQHEVPVIDRGLLIAHAFRADLIV